MWEGRWWIYVVERDGDEFYGYWEELDGSLNRFGEAEQYWDVFPAEWLVCAP